MSTVDALNRRLHQIVTHDEPCVTGCTHRLFGEWTALGLANVLARAAADDGPTPRPFAPPFGYVDVRLLDLAQERLDRANIELAEMREQRAADDGPTPRPTQEEIARLIARSDRYDERLWRQHMETARLVAALYDRQEQEETK